MSKNLRTSRHKALLAALAAARHKAGLSQRDLAAKLGRTHSFVGKIESGERRLEVLEFCEIADALGISASRLISEVSG